MLGEVAPREAKPLGELLRLAFLPPGCRIASRASWVRRASREDDDRHNRSYRHQVINGFLELMDAVSREEGVIVVGARNHPDRIDLAVLRAGRFDLTIEVPLPDAAAILGILRRSLGDGFDGEELSDLARIATGSSAAEVDAGVRKARAQARAGKWGSACSPSPCRPEGASARAEAGSPVRRPAGAVLRRRRRRYGLGLAGRRP